LCDAGGPAGFLPSTYSVQFNSNIGGYNWRWWSKPSIEVIGNIYEEVKNE